MKSAKEMDHLEAEPVLVSVQESVCTAYSIDPRDRCVVPNVGPAQHCCQAVCAQTQLDSILEVFCNLNRSVILFQAGEAAVPTPGDVACQANVLYLW